MQDARAGKLALSELPDELGEDRARLAGDDPVEPHRERLARGAARVGAARDGSKLGDAGPKRGKR